MGEADRWQREAERWRRKLATLPDWGGVADAPAGGEVGRLRAILKRVDVERTIAKCELNESRARVAELEEAIRQACEELDKWGRFGQCSILVTREMLRQALVPAKGDGDGYG